MNAILAIAFNTFKEAVRNRILYIILLFALIMIGSSGVISELTIAEKGKIIRDLGFTAINLFGVAIAIFVGVSLVYNELEKRTIYTIVSKPIDRWQFLLGKFLGLLMTIYINVVIMTFFFMFMLHYESRATEEGMLIGHVAVSFGRSAVNLFLWDAYAPTQSVMAVIMATCIELGIVTAFAVLFSAFSTPTLSMFFTVLTFIAGRMNEDILIFAENVKKQAEGAGANLPMSYYFAQGAAYVTPNLGIFHRTVEQAIYEDKVVIGFKAVLYAAMYSAAVLSLAMLIFSRRNFK